MMTNAEYAAQKAIDRANDTRAWRGDERFYMPWKFFQQSREHIQMSMHNFPRPPRAKGQIPALWSVSKQVRAETMGVYLQEQLLLDMSQTANVDLMEEVLERWVRRKLQIEKADAEEVLERWVSKMSTDMLATIRRIHVIVNCKLVVRGEFREKFRHLEAASFANDISGCDCGLLSLNSSWDEEDALFKLELRDEGKMLSLRSYCQLAPFQEDHLRKAVQAWAATRGTKTRFSGLDLLEIVRTIKTSVATTNHLRGLFHVCDGNEFPLSTFREDTWFLEATAENTETRVIKSAGKEIKLVKLRSGVSPFRWPGEEQEAVVYDHVIAEVFCGGGEAGDERSMAVG